MHATACTCMPIVVACTRLLCVLRSCLSVTVMLGYRTWPHTFWASEVLALNIIRLHLDSLSPSV